MTEAVRDTNPFRTLIATKNEAAAGRTLALDFAWVPSALFGALSTASDEHTHQFRVCERFPLEAASVTVVEGATGAADAAMNKENQPPATSHGSAPQSARFLCQGCHTWCFVTTTSFRTTCPHPGHATHHFHRADGVPHHQHDDFYCCGCDAHIQWSTHAPIVPNTVLDHLQQTRSLIRTYADSMQNTEQKPTLTSVLLTMRLYIKDLLLKDERREINTLNHNFVNRIGLDPASIELFGLAGFSLVDDKMVPPVGTLNEDALNMMYEELTASLYEIQSNTRNALGATERPLAEPVILNDYLGCQDALEHGSTMHTTRADMDERCMQLGITSQASDELIIWAYQQRIDEQPERTTEWFDLLVSIAAAKNTDNLQTQVAIERSRGLISTADIDQAYTHFGLQRNMSIDDTLLIGLHQVKASDEPHQKSTHDERLRILGQARNSHNIKHYLDHGYVPPEQQEEMQPVAPEDRSPIGLNNIGNTCYLNSLLQYYFSLVPFRDVVLDMNDYVENEDKADWQPKKIGGIEVDQKEVRRAKKFVDLLRQLFMQLQETDKRAISPEYDLAYMALLNERDDNSTLGNASDAKEGSSAVTLEESVSTLVESKKGSDDEPSRDDDVKQQPDAADIPRVEVQDASDAIDERISPEDGAEMGPNAARSASPENEAQIDATMEEPTPLATTSTTPAASAVVASSSSSSGDANASNKASGSNTKQHQQQLNSMMFGKQQDVTECMGNMMYLLEAALKPEETTAGREQTRDMVRDLFYGKGRQILTYTDQQKTIKKNKEEEFSHVIIDAVKAKHLYDGLDEYFFADKVENYREGQEAVREVSVQAFPPILQVLVQRVHFDRATANVYKSNAFIEFDKEIYLDRYCDAHFDSLAPRREKVAAWRARLAQCDQALHDLTANPAYPMPVPDMLAATANILQEYQDSDELSQQYQQAMQLLEDEIAQTRAVIEENTAEAKKLRHSINHEYDDMTENAYLLHAVFIHQGQANYGHYWVYLLDHHADQWWKFNDSVVTKVQESEIFKDTTGSTANPYFLVYIKKDKLAQLVAPEHSNQDVDMTL
ncbi:hypothetical protein BC940DRAFT_301744 [Gongronella butleri]|nr:hypothetical protein BC940DRAFT_301744 [Gongronella butleri]